MSKQPTNDVLNGKKTLSYWHHHITAFKESDLSKAAYCRHYKVNYANFLYWIKKLVETQHKPRLLPITLATAGTSKIPYMVELRQGHKIHVNELSALIALLPTLGG